MNIKFRKPKANANFSFYGHTSDQTIMPTIKDDIIILTEGQGPPRPDHSRPSINNHIAYRAPDLVAIYTILKHNLGTARLWSYFIADHQGRPQRVAWEQLTPDQQQRAREAAHHLNELGFDAIIPGGDL